MPLRTSLSHNGVVGPGGVGAAAPIVTAAQPAAEFRPYYEVKSNHTVWYDFAVMKLPHLFESLGKMGLVRRFDATLRLWVHTRTVNVTAGSPALRDLNYPENNSFSNTCPLVIYVAHSN